MVTTITRDEARALLARGARLVEVLAPEEYAKEHLAGAINIPIKSLDATTTAALPKDQPVIVYCDDLQ